MKRINNVCVLCSNHVWRCNYCRHELYGLSSLFVLIITPECSVLDRFECEVRASGTIRTEAADATIFLSPSWARLRCCHWGSLFLLDTLSREGGVPQRKAHLTSAPRGELWSSKVIFRHRGSISASRRRHQKCKCTCCILCVLWSGKEPTAARGYYLGMIVRRMDRSSSYHSNFGGKKWGRHRITCW